MRPSIFRDRIKSTRDPLPIADIPKVQVRELVSDHTGRHESLFKISRERKQRWFTSPAGTKGKLANIIV
jgi:hypothetical protein